MFCSLLSIIDVLGKKAALLCFRTVRLPSLVLWTSSAAITSALDQFGCHPSALDQFSCHPSALGKYASISGTQVHIQYTWLLAILLAVLARVCVADVIRVTGPAQRILALQSSSSPP